MEGRRGEGVYNLSDTKPEVQDGASCPAIGFGLVALSAASKRIAKRQRLIHKRLVL